MLWNKNQEMFAKVRSAANWLLPLEIQAFPGDFGELSDHLETHHNMNLTKSARFQEAQSSHPPFFFCGPSHHCSGSLQNREGFGEPDIAHLRAGEKPPPFWGRFLRFRGRFEFFFPEVEASFRGCEVFRAEGLLLLLSEQFHTKCNKGINLQRRDPLIWENTWKNFYNLVLFLGIDINDGLSLPAGCATKKQGRIG